MLAPDDQIEARLELGPLQLGNGSYLVTVATYRVCDLQDLSTAVFYEILARSYRIQVRDEIPTDETLFHHSATWSTGLIATARGEPTAENSMMLDATERLGGTVR